MRILDKRETSPLVTRANVVIRNGSKTLVHVGGWIVRVCFEAEARENSAICETAQRHNNPRSRPKSIAHLAKNMEDKTRSNVCCFGPKNPMICRGFAAPHRL